MLVIDDEADLASVDTRGSYQSEGEEPLPTGYEEPSIINGLIRDLLQRFQRCCLRGVYSDAIRKYPHSARHV